MGAIRIVTMWSNVCSFGILTVMILVKVYFSLSRELKKWCDGKVNFGGLLY